MKEAIISLKEELELERIQDTKNNKIRTIIAVIILLGALIWALSSNSEARKVIVENTRLNGVLDSKDSVIRGLREKEAVLSWVGDIKQRVDTIERKVDTIIKTTNHDNF